MVDFVKECWTSVAVMFDSSNGIDALYLQTFLEFASLQSQRIKRIKHKTQTKAVLKYLWVQPCRTGLGSTQSHFLNEISI